MKLNLPSIIGIFLLVLGVFAGVTLVQSSHDIRNKAKELKEHKVVICHKTGSDTNPWQQIEISENAVDEHLSHGDIRGNCPNQDDKNKDNKEQPENKGTGKDKEDKGTTIGTNVTINNNTTTVAGDDTETEIKYVYVNSRIDFWTKLLGIDKKIDDKKYRVMFKSGEEELHIFNNVTALADTKGVFKSTITDIRPGTFDFLVKPDGYLQKKFTGVAIVRGVNRKRFENVSLIPGDFDGNNIINGEDLAQLSSLISETAYPEVTDYDLFDLNEDGIVNIDDMKMVLENYNSLEVKGDE